ncbi:MAG: GH25 family lysozyme [Microcoleaceae cyanobacterium]
MSTIKGIDVSDYQPNVNWKAVASSGISFAIIKSTEGATYQAEVFPNYWKQTKANGLIRGAYHFFRAATNVQGQVDNFMKTVKLEVGDLPPVLDVESMDGVSAGDLLDRMGQWLEIIERETGFRPIVYTYPGFWQQLNTSRFSNYPLWIAHYTTATTPLVPSGWKDWMFWQFTDRGTVNGVDGGTDVNVFEAVSLGQSGTKVEKFQAILKQRGFDPGPVDGVFGNGTKSAVVSLQKMKGLGQDGVGDLKTWAALLGNLVATEGPVVQPQPTVKLTEIFATYKATAGQNTALNWLQQQVPAATLLEFSRLWRNQTTPQTRPIQLVDVARYYQRLPNQVKALDWLQQQLPNAVVLEFEKRWKATPPPPPPLKLTELCKFYQGLPHQVAALQWLEGQIPAQTMAEFAKRWRQSQ